MKLQFQVCPLEFFLNCDRAAQSQKHTHRNIPIPDRSSFNRSVSRSLSSILMVKSFQEYTLWNFNTIQTYIVFVQSENWMHQMCKTDKWWSSHLRPGYTAGNYYFQDYWTLFMSQMDRWVSTEPGQHWLLSLWNYIQIFFFFFTFVNTTVELWRPANN